MVSWDTWRFLTEPLSAGRQTDRQVRRVEGVGRESGTEPPSDTFSRCLLAAGWKTGALWVLGLDLNHVAGERLQVQQQGAALTGWHRQHHPVAIGVVSWSKLDQEGLQVSAGLNVPGGSETPRGHVREGEGLGLEQSCTEEEEKTKFEGQLNPDRPAVVRMLGTIKVEEAPLWRRSHKLQC